MKECRNCPIAGRESIDGNVNPVYHLDAHFLFSGSSPGTSEQGRPIRTGNWRKPWAGTFNCPVFFRIVEVIVVWGLSTLLSRPDLSGNLWSGSELRSLNDGRSWSHDGVGLRFGLDDGWLKGTLYTHFHFHLLCSDHRTVWGFKHFLVE